MDTRTARRLARLYEDFRMAEARARAQLMAEVTRQLEAGERPADIARAMGIRRQALHQMMTRTPSAASRA